MAWACTWIMVQNAMGQYGDLIQFQICRLKMTSVSVPKFAVAACVVLLVAIRAQSDSSERLVKRNPAISITDVLMAAANRWTEPRHAEH